jgi:hypothetical protein
MTKQQEQERALLELTQALTRFTTVHDALRDASAEVGRAMARCRELNDVAALSAA